MTFLEFNDFRFFRDHKTGSVRCFDKMIDPNEKITIFVPSITDRSLRILLTLVNKKLQEESLSRKGRESGDDIWSANPGDECDGTGGSKEVVAN